MADRSKRAARSSILTWLVDPLQPTRERGSKRFRFTGRAISWLAPLALGVALLVISVVGWIVDPKQFYFSYLVGWTFCLTISLGALYFVLFQHLSRAWWSVTVRRFAESMLWGFPLLAVLFIPIIFGMHDLYHWTHAELYTPGAEGFDPIIAGKRAYLNTPFFLIRMALYFVIWTFLSYKLYALSVGHDAYPSKDTPKKLRFHSAWGLPVTAITTAFASYDLLMSLDPHWFSTIFGVYMFAGAFFVALAMIALTGLTIQRTSHMLKDAVTVEHYHDLGKFMFGFVVFWAYIAFSQYVLIWYGGIPEETAFYRHRLEHGWGWHSALLVILHFIVPFFLLLPRFTKRIRPFLAFMCVWFAIVHWFDLHWLALPVLHADHAGFHWLDFACWLGLFGLFTGAFVWRLQRHALVPARDPHLADSLRFENV